MKIWKKTSDHCHVLLHFNFSVFQFLKGFLFHNDIKHKSGFNKINPGNPSQKHIFLPEKTFTYLRLKYFKPN